MRGIPIDAAAIKVLVKDDLRSNASNPSLARESSSTAKSPATALCECCRRRPPQGCEHSRAVTKNGPVTHFLFRVAGSMCRTVTGEAPKVWGTDKRTLVEKQGEALDAGFIAHSGTCTRSHRKREYDRLLIRCRLARPQSILAFHLTLFVMVARFSGT